MLSAALIATVQTVCFAVNLGMTYAAEVPISLLKPNTNVVVAFSVAGLGDASLVPLAEHSKCAEKSTGAGAGTLNPKH